MHLAFVSGIAVMRQCERLRARDQYAHCRCRHIHKRQGNARTGSKASASALRSKRRATGAAARLTRETSSLISHDL